MDTIYAAACCIDREVIRLVLIAEDQLEAAKEAFFRASPKLADRTASDRSVGVTFHEVPVALALALNLGRGQTQEWWLGDVPSQRIATPPQGG